MIFLDCFVFIWRFYVIYQIKIRYTKTRFAGYAVGQNNEFFIWSETGNSSQNWTDSLYLFQEQLLYCWFVIFTWWKIIRSWKKDRLFTTTVSVGQLHNVRSFRHTA